MMKFKTIVLATGVLTLALLMIVACSKDSLTAQKSSSTTADPVVEMSEGEVITTFSLDLSATEIADIVVALIDDLPNAQSSILIVPDQSQGIATVYEGGEPDPDPDKYFVWGCDYSYPYTHVCHDLTNTLLDNGCSLSGYDDGTQYVYIADCP